MLSRLRTDFKRDTNAANSPTAPSWSLSCGSLANTCSVVRNDFDTTNFPPFFADPRCDFLSFTLPKPRMYINPLPASLLVSCSFVANSCSSCTGKGKHHKIGVGAPKTFLIGDEFLPPTCGENGDCCPVVRVRGGSFRDIKLILDLQIQEGLVIPSRSVALVFLLSHLLKSGPDKFWVEYKDFSTWAHKSNLITIPCLQPYPTLAPEHLNTIRQFYCRLQISHHGNNTKSNNPRFAFWQPLATTANTSENATIGPVPMSTFFLQSAGSPVSATGDFCTGFGSDWTNGMPSEVEKKFFLNLFSTLRSNIHSSEISAADVRIPADCSVTDGLQELQDDTLAHLHGRKIFCMGSSIIERAREQLIKQSKIYKFDVISLCKPGRYIKFFHKQNLDTYLAPLACAKEDDIIFISMFGNEMVNKTKHKQDDNRMFHIEDPRFLSTGEFNILVADAMHVINAVKKRFKGSIVVIGPTPRHLVQCCDISEHHLKDELGIKADMLRYCEVFSDQLRRNLPLSADSYFVDFRQIFGNDFSTNSLYDHVHLDEIPNRTYANFLLRGIEVLLPAPPLEDDMDASFSDAMHTAEIIVPSGEKELEKVDDDPYNFDNLDYEG